MTWPFPMESAHPMFVHAPIGLLSTAVILDLLATALRHPGMRRVALWNLALDRKSTRLNSSHSDRSRMPSSA